MKHVFLALFLLLGSVAQADTPAQVCANVKAARASSAGTPENAAAWEKVFAARPDLRISYTYRAYRTGSSAFDPPRVAVKMVRNGEAVDLWSDQLAIVPGGLDSLRTFARQFGMQRPITSQNIQADLTPAGMRNISNQVSFANLDKVLRTDAPPPRELVTKATEAFNALLRPLQCEALEARRVASTAAAAGTAEDDALDRKALKGADGHKLLNCTWHGNPRALPTSCGQYCVGRADCEYELPNNQSITMKDRVIGCRGTCNGDATKCHKDPIKFPAVPLADASGTGGTPVTPGASEGR